MYRYMSLANFYYNYNIERISDKGYIHSYIDCYYTNRFTSIKDHPLTILEIGIYYARSIQLWKDWFTNASIYCIDINEDSVKRANSIPGIKGLLGSAYSENILNTFNDGFFDIIIEDGPHTLDTQVYAVKHWSKKLKKNGTLIIEDIQDINHVNTLIDAIPSEQDIQFKNCYFDLRHVKNRYDDILLEITRL